MSNVVPYRAPHSRGLPTCMKPKEAAYELSICVDKVYDMLRKGEIPSIRAGTRWVIPRDEFYRWLNQGVAAR